MITRDQVIPMLLAACPSFSDKLAEAREFYEDDDLLYVYFGEFAHHLISLYKDEKTEEFEAVFDLAERLHIEGDDYVREVATIGMLESIQNVAGNSGIDRETFLPFLKPESIKWWTNLNDFWKGKTAYVGGPSRNE